MIDDLRLMISRRTAPALNFGGGDSPRRYQFNPQGNATLISRPFKPSLITHRS
jgi:hypothetical protein